MAPFGSERFANASGVARSGPRRPARPRGSPRGGRRPARRRAGRGGLHLGGHRGRQPRRLRHPGRGGAPTGDGRSAPSARPSSTPRCSSRCGPRAAGRGRGARASARSGSAEVGVDARRARSTSTTSPTRSATRTALVSVMTANNEVGTIQPLDRGGRPGPPAGPRRRRCTPTRCRPPPTSTWPPSTAGCDLVSVSAHKLGGPRGSGRSWCGARTGSRRCSAAGARSRSGGAAPMTSAGIVGLAAALRAADGAREAECSRVGGPARPARRRPP